MNDIKYEYYYVVIDGRVGGLRSCYSEHKYETYSKALDMFNLLLDVYMLINNTNVTLSIVGSSADNTDMMTIDWVKVDNI